MVKIYRKHYSYALRCMRITTLLFGIQACFASVLMASTTTAQNINLNIKQANIKQVFISIEQQTKVTFVYNEETIHDLKKVSITASDKSLADVLKALSSQVPLLFKQAGSVIGVSRKMPDGQRAPDNSEFQPSPSATGVTGLLPKDIKGIVTDETGQPLSNATVKVKGTGQAVSTNGKGEFYFNNVPDTATLIISYIGYKSKAVKIAGLSQPLMIRLEPDASALKEVVVSNGYQSLPQERATGSYDQIDNQLINRATGTNILDRINGISSGVLFSPTTIFSGIFTGGQTNIRETGITIRGTSTLSPNTVGTDPLIILDNFPYAGDMGNINPNDVESITILKDAAAASIWGAKAGNGVIVITTKKGSKNHAPQIDFNSNVTIGNKPNVFYDKNYLDSKDFIKAETYLFNQGYFNSNLSDNTDWPVISPAVEILAAQQAGSISAADATAQLNALGNNDVRDDYEKYIYQKSLDQQYSLGIRGGSPQLTYSESIGYDDNKDNLVRNGEQRLTINSLNTYTPVKSLDITAGINYSQRDVQMNNQEGWGNISSGGGYGLIPYSLFAGPSGNPLSIPMGYRTSYVDSLQKLGFEDIHYRPLTELQIANNTAQITDLILKTSVTYHFGSHFNAQAFYQNERQVVATSDDQPLGSYYTDNLIDEFAVYNSATKTFTYPFPVGDILNMSNTTLDEQNLRGQLNFNETFNHKNVITALAGAEINQSVATSYFPTSLGYNSEFGTSTSTVDYYDYFPVNPSGYNAITPPNTAISVITYHYLSYFANAGYTYDNRYTFTLSGRKDGANIFGANTNDRITPLWSAGLGWNISNEAYYHSDWLTYLKLRTSYGFSGNVYNGSAYTTGTYNTSSQTGLTDITNLTAPNPDLQWEKVKNINIGLDFAVARNIISGTIEIYQKDGEDLLETEPLPGSTGFSSFVGNAASTKTNGIDITLVSRNINGQFKWSTTLLTSVQENKVTNYDVPLTNTSIQTGDAVVGKPIYSVFSYKWAGIDQTNGNPMGYLNGKISEDYTDIINNYKPDSLKYNGSAVPTIFGSLRNDFSYGGFGLSFNIKYELGYYFRRPSVSLDYSDILQYPNSDYTLAWTHPGQQTDVPSLIYPSNPNRNTFYQYSSILVQNADNIRLQDVRVSYDITKRIWHGMPFSSLQLYSYANNIGILWRANKFGIDPDTVPSQGLSQLDHNLPAPFTIAFGLKATY